MADDEQAARPAGDEPSDAGFTLDEAGRRVNDGWDHDSDLIASFQGDLNRQREAGDRVASAARQVRLVNGALRGIDELNDAADAWEATLVADADQVAETCSPECGCKHDNDRDAVARAARVAGLDPSDAQWLMTLLKAHGWVLARPAAHVGQRDGGAAGEGSARRDVLRAAGDELAEAAGRVQLVNGALRGIDDLNDAANAWRGSRG